jgi:uncharacterized protein DUF4136
MEGFMKLRNILAFVASAAVLSFSIRGFADEIKVDYNHHVDFGSYHTYSWNKIQVSNQLSAGRIKRAVNSLLQQNGWQEVPSGAQVTIMATDNIHNEQEAETYYTE